MKRTMIRTSLMASALFITAGCSSFFNGQQDALSVADEHPISVDSQIVTLTLDTDITTTDISGLDNARLRAFAATYLQKGHGPITVTAPSGASADRDGQEAASDIRKALNAAGVPWDVIAGATYRTGGDGSANQIIVSYTHYVATPSECGVWTGTLARTYKNLRTPNFGCATMNNYAAMIADPHDLIAAADEDATDTPARVRAIEEFRAGNVTSSDTDNTIQTQVSQ